MRLHALHSSIGISTLCVSLLLTNVGCSKKLTAGQATAKQSRIEINQPSGSNAAWIIRTGTAEFHVLADGSVTPYLLQDGNKLTIERHPGPPSDSVIANGSEVKDFTPQGSPKISDAKGKLGGGGKRLELIAKSPSTGLERTTAIEVYGDFPNLAVISTAYKSADKEVNLGNVITQRHAFDASEIAANVKPYEMWSFQGASLDWGKDEVQAIPANYSEQNPMGRPVKEGNYGGGVPVNAFWTRKVGVAIGHLETLPFVLDMPVKVNKDQQIETAIELIEHTMLKRGEVYSIPRTFVAVYAGDFYEPLRMYSLALQREGWPIPKPTKEGYSVAWCGWGYEFDVTPKQMTDTIPKLKDLNINWATLDDRWFDTYGDWNPRKETFPGESIKTMTDEFHRNNINAQIWWIPIAVEDGQGRWPSHKYSVAQVAKEHPDWLILDEHGKHARMTRNLAALCPALPEVQQYHKQLTEKFIRTWGFDGHKLDNIYTVPACYNPKHRHKSPNDSINAMGEVYKQIFETTRALKPQSVTQSCPCGTTPNIAWLPYMDQAVTADPVGGNQVRWRIKWYKALLGPEAAVYGDHVELSEMKRSGKDGWVEYGRDFASTVGTGGVPGTKFTRPSGPAKFKKTELSPDKEQHWRKWISLYQQKMLSKGEFRNLYTIGYDSPEGYAIAKDGKMYYAFFTKDTHTKYEGTIELRGLDPGSYQVVDYPNSRDLGIVQAPNATVRTQFTGSLLLEVSRH
jgi:alpha-galactosidase